MLPINWLTTVFLWCIIHGKVTRACAPTGIAAANVEIQGTPVSATTLHALFDLDTDLRTVERSKCIPPYHHHPFSPSCLELPVSRSKLDFSKLDNDKVKQLMKLELRI